MPKTCARCQQYTKVAPCAFSSGAVEELCRRCGEQAILQDLLHPKIRPAPSSLRGRVMGPGGGARGVLVSVRSSAGQLTRSVQSDSSGSFDLGCVAFDAMRSTASELHALLAKHKSGGCEAWLRAALERSRIPTDYEALFRCSDIGAALDHDTFVDLVTRKEVASQIAAQVFKFLGLQPVLVLSFTKAGFAPSFLPVDIGDHAFSESALEVKLQRVRELGTVNPVAGGFVEDRRTGATVTLAPNTQLVTLDGRSFDGEVRVSCSVIDVTDPRGVEAMPGDYSAVDADGKAGQLQSFGAMYVGLCSAAGERLELAKDSPGMALSFMSSASASFEHSAVPPSLYEFDAGSGKWIQNATGVLDIEGVVMPKPGQDQAEVFVKVAPAAKAKAKAKARGKKKGGPRDEFHQQNHFGFIAGAQVWTKNEFEKLLGQPLPRRVTVENVPRTGYWNCDNFYETSFVSGRIVNEDGAPVTTANVFSMGASYCGASPRSGVTEQGGFSVLGQCLSNLELIVLVPIDTSESSSPSLRAEFGTRATKGRPSQRFKFGPFQTDQPLKELAVGELKLSKGTLVPEEDTMKQKILSTFNEWDIDGRGFISEKDLCVVLQRIGVPHEQIHAVFEAADVNKDGKIDYEEFLDWILRSPENQQLMDSDPVDSVEQCEE